MTSFFINIGIGIAVLGISALFIAIGMWLDTHGGWHRWQVWLMAVIASALLAGAIFMAIQPLDLHTIGLGAGLGALIGSITGLIIKVPPPSRSNTQRRETTRLQGYNRTIAVRHDTYGKHQETVTMYQQDTVLIPPKRLRLLGIFCGSLLYLPFAYLVSRVMLAATEQGQSFLVQAFAILVVIACIVSVPFFILFAVWAFVRLVFNLPALILTPAGVVNHSVVYHVVIPWSEIEQFVRFLPPSTPPSTPRRLRTPWRLSDIIVDQHDAQRLYAQQRPVTKALLRLFSALRPVNINTDVTAGTPEAVWTQLERYVRETLSDTRIKFVTVRPTHSTRP